MFQHDDHFQVDDEDNEEEVERDESEKDEQIDNDSISLSEIESVLLKVEKAKGKVSDLLKSSKLKCEKCDFTAKIKRPQHARKSKAHRQKQLAGF